MSPAPPNRRTPQQVLTERVRFVSATLLALFLLGWIGWFWPYDDLLDRSGTPLGADFSMFYVAGQLASAGEVEHLYDQAAHQARLHRQFPGIDPQFALPYRYPPLVAFLLAPLARLPYGWAVGIFLGLGLLAAVTSLWLLMRENIPLARERWRLGLLAVLGWPVVLETWIGGQASLFGLSIVCVGVVLMQRQRYAWAGAVWALAAYKPNLLLLVILGCVLFRPRTLRGLLPAMAILIGLTWWTSGWAGIQAYLDLTLQLAAQPWDVETPFWKVHGIAPWLTLVVGDHARLVALVLGLAATGCIVWRWRQTDNDPTSPLPYALLITVNALANPYTPIYDLTLLAAGFVLMASLLARVDCESLVNQSTIWQLVLAVCYFGPHLSQLLARPLGFQTFPLLLLGYAVLQARLWRPAPSTAATGTGPAGTVAAG